MPRGEAGFGKGFVTAPYGKKKETEHSGLMDQKGAAKGSKPPMPSKQGHKSKY